MILRVGKLFFIGALAVLFSRAAYSQATMGSLDQNADQSQGQYMPMNLGYAGFNSLGMTQAAWLDPLQNLGEGQSKPAYSKYYWSPDLILPIRLREGMITLLNFPQWELIEDMFETMYEENGVGLAASQAMRKLSLLPATSSTTSAPPWALLCRTNSSACAGDTVSTSG